MENSFISYPGECGTTKESASHPHIASLGAVVSKPEEPGIGDWCGRSHRERRINTAKRCEANPGLASRSRHLISILRHPPALTTTLHPFPGVTFNSSFAPKRRYFGFNAMKHGKTRGSRTHRPYMSGCGPKRQGPGVGTESEPRVQKRRTWLPGRDGKGCGKRRVGNIWRQKGQEPWASGRMSRGTERQPGFGPGNRGQAPGALGVPLWA